MSYGAAIQTAIYQALANDLDLSAIVTGVYDQVPQGSNYPYVSLGELNQQEWDTGNTLGKDVSITIHSWSRYRGKKETFQIQEAIYNALHRAELSYTGYRFISCDEESATDFMDADGLTRHGVLTYRILIDKQ